MSLNYQVWNITVTATAFSSLALPRELTDNLSTLGYTQMTPVQAQSLPVILQGKDIIAQAKTGSGKTAAFSLGVLAKLNVKRFRIQSLILCPTRELAEQVAEEVRKLARGIHNIKVLTLCGGVSIGPQIGSLEHGAHIIVGTPGRVLDMIGRKYLYTKDIKLLEYLHLDQSREIINFVIIVDKISDELLGIHAFIPYSHFDSELEEADIFLSIWKVKKAAKIPALGLKSIEFIQKNFTIWLIRVSCFDRFGN